MTPFQSNAGSKNSYEKRDKNKPVSEETQVLFSYKTEHTSHSSACQSGEKSTSGKCGRQDEVLKDIAMFPKFKRHKNLKRSDSMNDLFEKTFAAQLKMFPELRKCLKHKITNLIYRHQKMEAPTLQIHFGISLHMYEAPQSSLQRQQNVTPIKMTTMFFDLQFLFLM